LYSLRVEIVTLPHRDKRPQARYSYSACSRLARIEGRGNHDQGEWAYA